ncbi:YkvA family protein [Nonomuraea ferruginea]
MTGSWGWDLLIGIVAALLVAWLALIATLAIVRPRGGLLREALRLLPDVLRLVRRLAADPGLPRGVRVRLALLLAYLALPLDLVPDFIPVLGYADDVIVVTMVLRSVVRRAGLEAVRSALAGHRRRPRDPDPLDRPGQATRLARHAGSLIPGSVRRGCRGRG